MKKTLRRAALGLLTFCMGLGSGVAFAQNDGLVLKLRADSYDDSTGIWADTSGDGRDMKQLNPADLVRPSKVTGQTPNGNSVVRFDRSDFMRLDFDDWILPANIYLDEAQTELNPASGVTYVAYVRPDAYTEPGDGRWLISGQGGSPTWLFTREGYQWGFQLGGGRLNFSNTANNNFGCYSFSLDRTGGEMRINGAFDGELKSVDTILSGGPGPAWNSINTLGYGGGVPNATFRGDIAEIRIYNRKLTPAEIEAVEAELCAAYEEEPNAAPTANAGADQSIHAGETVSLDGSASSDDNTPEAELDYLWEIVEAPENSTATLDVTNPIKPTFVADRDGDYVINLTVTDAGELSATDTVIISSFNQAPTAVATELVSGSTEHLMFLGDSVVLDGSDSSDSDGDEISYQWTITDAPLGSFPEFLDTDTEFPTLIPDVEGAYTVELVVSDFLGPGEPVTVDITVTLAIEYAENLIMEACDIVDSLSKDQVAKKGNRKKLKKELAKAIKEIQKGHICHAIKALNKVIRRVDGYPLRGELDCRGKSRDWVLDEDAQRDIYGLLTLAIETLE